jgi:hypothetical protein
VDTSLISAASGLLGATIGGLTAFGTNWTVQRAQIRAKALDDQIKKRERLFEQFITESSRLFGEALTHENNEITPFVPLYANIANLRLVATRAVIEAAEAVMHLIIETNLAPNRTLREFGGVTDASKKRLDFLLHFSEACRRELADLAWH